MKKRRDRDEDVVVVGLDDEDEEHPYQEPLVSICTKKSGESLLVLGIGGVSTYGEDFISKYIEEEEESNEIS